jgi:hypothetical protein
MDSICQHHLRIVIVLRSTVSQKQKQKKILTCNPASSQRSQPCFIIFLAATILPACSSKQAAAIHPGACIGLDLTKESNVLLIWLVLEPLWGGSTNKLDEWQGLKLIIFTHLLAFLRESMASSTESAVKSLFSSHMV